MHSTLKLQNQELQDTIMKLLDYSLVTLPYNKELFPECYKFAKVFEVNAAEQ